MSSCGKKISRLNQLLTSYFNFNFYFFLNLLIFYLKLLQYTRSIVFLKTNIILRRMLFSTYFFTLLWIYKKNYLTSKYNYSRFKSTMYCIIWLNFYYLQNYLELNTIAINGLKFFYVVHRTG